MKQIAACVMAFIAGVATVVLAFQVKNQPSPSWRLIYAHDGAGQAEAGSKEALIEAVRQGKSIRVYWAGKRVEHLTDSHFLTILQGEVFAQIAVIRGQKPSVDPANVAFHDPDRNWNAIFATNGKRPLKWFVQD